MGTFELSLKFKSSTVDDDSNTSKNKQPLFELTMTNNLLNVRTCADSCVALTKLVQYFASDGDLTPLSDGAGDSGDQMDSERDMLFNVRETFLVNCFLLIVSFFGTLGLLGFHGVSLFHSCFDALNR